MDKDIEYNEALKKLKTYGQEQVLDRYNFLDDNKKQKLIKQIKNIDFDQIQELFIEKDKKIDDKACKITNIEYVDKSKLSKEEYERYNEIGTKIIQEGKYAVVTMAGGQGTRLGYVAPKGTFKIGGGIDKSLFEALSKRN